MEYQLEFELWCIATPQRNTEETGLDIEGSQESRHHEDRAIAERECEQDVQEEENACEPEGTGARRRLWRTTEGDRRAKEGSRDTAEAPLRKG